MMRILALLLSVLAFSAFAAEPRLNKALNEQVIFIENGSGLFSTEIEATLFKPDGDGPFPLVVINHGKEAGNPRFQARARYVTASREFVRRGYAVLLPMRGGFSRSTGGYIEGGCNIAGNGIAQANDVRAAIDHAAKLPFIDARRIVVVGQSHGGLTTMAFGTLPYPGVLGLINFAGGLRLPGCPAWERALVEAFADYGKGGRTRSLWFYGENDSYWPRGLVKDMHAAYAAGGGRARLVAFGRFKNDAHGLFGQPEGVAIWWPEVEKFLVALGLPVQPLPAAITEPERQRLQAAGSVPAIADHDRCRRLYQFFLDADYPRAFAVSGEGRCGYAWGGEDPQRRAIDFCRGKTDAACTVYAVDDDIVGQQAAGN